MKSSLLNHVFEADAFEAQLQPLGALIQNHLENVLSEKKDHVLRWNPPEKELEFWRSFMNSGDTNDFFPEILKKASFIPIHKRPDWFRLKFWIREMNLIPAQPAR